MITATLSLEEQSLWYGYKRAVWNHQTEQTNTIHNIMRVLRAIRQVGDLVYVSVPITSGRYLYDLRIAQPHLAEVTRIELAINHNYLEGWQFVEALKGRLACPILYPADLTPVHQEWEQVHFQALWLSIIAEKCKQLHMSRGWEYSNGGCEEFTHVMQLRLGVPRDPDGQLIFFNTKEEEVHERERMRSIEVFDHLGSRLTIDDGIRRIERALQWIQRSGFEAPKIERCLALLKETLAMLEVGFYQ